VKVSGLDTLGNGTRTVTIGSCDRLSDDAFVAVVEALADAEPPTTTTTTTEPTEPTEPTATTPPTEASTP
jgi:hypothetical protein